MLVLRPFSRYVYFSKAVGLATLKPFIPSQPQGLSTFAEEQRFVSPEALQPHIVGLAK